MLKSNNWIWLFIKWFLFKKDRINIYRFFYDYVGGIIWNKGKIEENFIVNFKIIIMINFGFEFFLVL